MEETMVQPPMEPTDSIEENAQGSTTESSPEQISADELPNDMAVMNVETKSRGRKRKAASTADGEQKPRPRIGRTRSVETISRDETVFLAIKEYGEKDGGGNGITREDLSARLQMESNLVYLSLWRLRRDNRVTRIGAGGNTRWIIASPTSVGAENETVTATATNSESASVVDEDAVAVASETVDEDSTEIAAADENE